MWAVAAASTAPAAPPRSAAGIPPRPRRTARPPTATAHPWRVDRFYVIRVEGPDDHPAQGLGDIGDWLYLIKSLLVHDAERGVTRLLVPGPEDHRRRPVLRVRDGVGSVYATPDCEVGVADREFPLDAP